LLYDPDRSIGESGVHMFVKDDDVRHQPQGPRRANDRQENIYTVIARLPVEMDGRVRYRIRSKTENVERIVTEDQLSRPL
jgi:hypothetical protein